MLWCASAVLRNLRVASWRGTHTGSCWPWIGRLQYHPAPETLECLGLRIRLLRQLRVCHFVYLHNIHVNVDFNIAICLPCIGKTKIHLAILFVYKKGATYPPENINIVEFKMYLCVRERVRVCLPSETSSSFKICAFFCVVSMALSILCKTNKLAFEQVRGVKNTHAVIWRISCHLNSQALQRGNGNV